MTTADARRAILDSGRSDLYDIQTNALGPAGELPIDAEMLAGAPSGDLFGWTENAGMGWAPDRMRAPEYLVLSTMGGLRAPGGRPLALGYHTGHWELGLLVEEAAREFARLGAIPFAAYCSDPCDGRTQGTPAMMDSLAYRNDAAIVMRRLIRSLPHRAGVVGVATCDKGLPAMMMALASMRDLPCVLVPGGVTLPPAEGEDAGTIQSIGARFAQGAATLEYARKAACRACASPGGGCQFLGTAGTAQVVGEALGLALPHSALAPSGQPIWRDLAARSARAAMELARQGIRSREIVSAAAIRNAMTVHAAFGGSTNLLLHLPAIAHAAGLERPGAEDWRQVNRATPRLVDALPNGPVGHPTVRVFLAGGVPEAMLHLRDLGLLDLDAMTAAGQPLGENLQWWERSERRARVRDRLLEREGIDPGDVVCSPRRARELGMISTVAILAGNLAPDGSVIKTSAIDPNLIGSDGVFRHEGPARVFVAESAAIEAIKRGAIRAGDTMILCCCGPMGSGMEEIYQVTSALKCFEWGKRVAVVTDARFSGFSGGACIGHAGPEALAGGPLGKAREGDAIRIEIDCRRLEGRVDFVGAGNDRVSPEEGARILAARKPNPALAPRPDLAEDTRLWAALQAASGGTWGGCVYDAAAIAGRLGA